MVLRGLTLNNEFVTFGPEDCPVYLDDNRIVLSSRKNSPIIQAKTVVRGSKESNCFESDYVISKDSKMCAGFLYYNKGLKLYVPVLKISVPFTNYSEFDIVPATSFKDLGMMRSLATPITFCYGDWIFGVADFVLSEHDSIYMRKKLSAPMVKSDIKFSTDIEIDGRLLCFGDFYGGGIVVLHKNRPMVKLQGEEKYIEIEEES